MINRYTLLVLIACGLIFIFAAYYFYFMVTPDDISDQVQSDSGQVQVEPEPTPTQDASSMPDDQSSAPELEAGLNGKFTPPVASYQDRVTFKSFGTYVNPNNSPVQPERFTGYHAGTDFEILPGEENSVVEVRAICDGKLAIKRTAQGYGGLVAQYCVYNGEPVLVLYGHVALSSVPFKLDDDITAGEVLGHLGQPGPDTDDERKHLHLGIRRGHQLLISGYVQGESGLSAFIDPIETF